MVTRAWGEDERRVTANGDGVSFWGDKDVLDSGDSLYNTVNVRNATELYTSKCSQW